MAAWDDKTAQGYADKWGDDPSIFAVLERVRIAPDARVLDVGCGTGSALRHLAGDTRQLTGVDPTPRLVEIARAAGGATYFEAPAEALPVADGSVDVLLALNSIHHWEDQSAGLREARRVLTPGGLIVLGGEAFGSDMLPGGQDYTPALEAHGFTEITREEGEGFFVQTARRGDV